MNKILNAREEGAFSGGGGKGIPMSFLRQKWAEGSYVLASWSLKEKKLDQRTQPREEKRLMLPRTEEGGKRGKI